MSSDASAKLKPPIVPPISQARDTDAPPYGANTTNVARTLDPRDVELLTNSVAEKALEKITRSVRWPLILAAALATYTGYNLWSDTSKRVETFQKAADEKLSQIDKSANERLNKQLQTTLDTRKADLTELTTLLRKESAAALVEAERARATSIASAKEIEQTSKDTIARLKSEAEKTIAALEAQLREVQARGQSVLLAITFIETNISKPNLELIKNDPSRLAGGLLTQDALRLIGVKQAIEEIDEAKPVTVAVLSTGVAKFKTTPNGETLEGRLVPGKSFIPNLDMEDKNGHGTWMASLVAVMVPKAQILPVRVLSNEGHGDDSNILAGLNYAESEGAKIVVLSIGSPGIPGKPPSTIFTDVFRRMRAKGLLVFVSAGNDGDVVGHPANCPHAIAVTSTNLKDEISKFANTGPEVALAAPGEDIVIVGPDGTYNSRQGTSFSAPIAAGVAALVLSARPDLSVDDVESILRQSAKTLDVGADKVGAGRVDALAAVRLAKTFTASNK